MIIQALLDTFFKLSKLMLVKRTSLSTLVLLVFLALSNALHAQNSIIKNDIFWNTKDGKPIYSQGGGIFKFPDPVTGKEKYYWYGVSYKESALYRLDPSVTQPRSTFEAVTCYSSTDFVNWTAEPNANNETCFFLLTILIVFQFS